MRELLAIGSVVEVKDTKLFVLGSRMIENEGVMKLHYCVVPYPRGFASRSSVGVVLSDDITNIISNGYVDEAGERYLKGKNMLNQYVDGETKEEAYAKMQTMTEEVKKVFEEIKVKKTLKGSES